MIVVVLLGNAFNLHFSKYWYIYFIIIGATWTYFAYYLAECYEGRDVERFTLETVRGVIYSSEVLVERLRGFAETYKGTVDISPEGAVEITLGDREFYGLLGLRLTGRLPGFCLPCVVRAELSEDNLILSYKDNFREDANHSYVFVKPYQRYFKKLDSAICLAIK
ncbi:MAG: hypothetical protein V3T30_00810 [Thermodesulfobacteriota bacterium]